MGQKVHPTGIRLGIVKDWSSRWYANTKDYAKTLHEDLKIRRLLTKRLARGVVGRVDIERPAKNAKITIHTSRPGVIIGKNGRDVEVLRDNIGEMLGLPVHINIEEIRKPDLNAKIVADSIAMQLEKRVSFRRAMKRSVSNTMRAGALGIKVSVAGRLGGAEIARTEWYREGRVPLHTFRADIDYATAEALTTYGIIGVKIWIFKGEVIGNKLVDTSNNVADDKPKRPKKRTRREQ
jgi:small subunit ribosomal protein S3